MKKKILLHFSLAVAFCLVAKLAKSQTADDAIMMGKKQWCNGLTYMYSSWKNYWEGTLKRENKNLGTVSTQSIMFMSTYGITNKLNAIVSVPYIWTHASAGTLHGLKGFQDIEMDIKYEFFSAKFKKDGRLSLFVVGGLSTPLQKYENDFLPMSIGMGSTNLSGRLTVDYQQGIFFATASSAYEWRSDVT